MMKPIHCLWILAGLSLCTAANAQAADVKLIANTSVSASKISIDEVKAVFLVTRTSLGDSQVEPVLGKSGPAHDAFLKEYLGKTDAALTTYYRSLVFTGKASMPKICDSDAAVVEYIAKTKGAIGYVSANAATAGTKTIEVK